MNKGIYLALFILFVWLFAHCVGAMDVYIFAGQSNMSGVAPIAGEPATVNGANLWMLRGLASQWVTAKDPTNPYSNAVSPALWAGDKLCSLSGNQVGIINVAYPGTYMYEWAPDYSVHSRYGTIMGAYRAACQEGTVKGFIWYQGEADGDNADDVHAYGPRMYAFLNAVHRDLGNVPVVFVQLGPNPNYSGLPYWGAIQEIQGWIALGAPPWLAMVSAIDLKCLPGNPYHLNCQSEITLGGRMGVAMWNLICEGQ